MATEGFRSTWCEVSYPDGPVVALRAVPERPVVNFGSMTDAEILEAAKRRWGRSDVLALLTEGYLRKLLNATGEARLSELLREDEEARQEDQEAARFRQAHAGMDREEVAAMLREGGRR